MTSHYFSNELVNLHYYKFGRGDTPMFCFHGYGMHGRQFRSLEESLGAKYTFYGFDLFFHKRTLLHDQSLPAVKQGISKSELAGLFREFCESEQIQKFSLIAYSMGSHYASSLVEEMPEFVSELIMAAPASLRPGRILTFLSTRRVGNKLLERMALSERAMPGLLALLRKLRIIDQQGYEILFREVGTPELRFSFYACTSYMRYMSLDAPRFIRNLNDHQIPSVFVFGKRDKNYPPSIGQRIIPRIRRAREIVLDADHDMINANFAAVLAGITHDH